MTHPGPLQCNQCGATHTANGQPFTPQGLASHQHTHKTRICRTCGQHQPLNTIGSHNNRCAANPPNNINPWWTAYPAAGWQQAIEEHLAFTDELPSTRAALVITGNDNPLYRGHGDAIREAANATRRNRPTLIIPAALLVDLWDATDPQRLRRVDPPDPHNDEHDDPPPTTYPSFLTAP